MDAVAEVEDVTSWPCLGEDLVDRLANLRLVLKEHPKLARPK